MSSLVLLDTGPLVAILDKRDQQHVWATGIAARFPPPWQTCEAVISEACFLTLVSTWFWTATRSRSASARETVITCGGRSTTHAVTRRILTVIDGTERRKSVYLHEGLSADKLEVSNFDI